MPRSRPSNNMPHTIDEVPVEGCRPHPRQADMPHTIVQVPIDSLRPHPRQAELFSDLSEAEVAALAADIAAHGLREPIHILPDGTILAGHQRVCACVILQWTTIPAIVRHDLVGKPNDSIEFLVADNFHRRQLDLLGLVRSYAALLDVIQSSPIETRGARLDTLRQEFIARLESNGYHVSMKTISRYTDLLKLARPIQDAIAAKRLSHRDGAALLRRSASEQKAIADACAAGKNKAELAEMLREMRGASPPLSNLRFWESLGVIVKVGKSSGRLEEIADHYAHNRSDIERLEFAKDAIGMMLMRITNTVGKTTKGKVSRSAKGRAR